LKTIPSAVLSAWLLFGALSAEELPRAAPKDVGLSDEKLDHVKTLVQAAVDKNQTAGVAVLVARRGKVALLESFGRFSAKADRSMSSDAIFRIHSMTKPITTTAALVLYDEGRFKLDESVAKYLPELQGLRVYAGNADETVEANREITIRDLMRHTSGLTYGMPDGTPVDKMYIQSRIPDSGDTLAEMVRKLGKLPLSYQPGTRFHYSLSTGRLIEVVSEKPFDEFLRDRVLTPLDMQDTGFFVPEEKLDRFASSHRVDVQGVLQVIDGPATSRYRNRHKFLSAGGGLVSTARDYARFCQMLLNGGSLEGRRLLRPETVQEMTTNQLPGEALPMTLGGMAVPGLGFGLGVSVRLDTQSSKPDPASGEYGWSGAASTFFWIAPKEELIVIVLQQIEPISLQLQMSLKPAIYAAIER
jgi:CubicO group peptidase (beta-lactamase class C family)